MVKNPGGVLETMFFLKSVVYDRVFFFLGGNGNTLKHILQKGKKNKSFGDSIL